MRWIGLVALALCACAKSEGTSLDAGAGDAGHSADAGPLGDAGPQPTERCGDGSPLVHYAMTPVSPLPAPGATGLPHPIATMIIAAAGEHGERRVRLDVCETTSGPVLRGVLAMENTFETPTWWMADERVAAVTREVVEIDGGTLIETRMPPSAMKVTGLAEALSGDLSRLEIRLVTDFGALFVGRPGFVAFARGNVTAADIEYTSLTVIVGGLARGDPFAGMRCPFGQQPLDETFRLGTATFTLGGCRFLGGGATIGYTIDALSVEDSSPMLMAADRRRFTFATKAEVDAVLTYQWNHHNACDSFHLALPHADYAASSAPAAGCGTQVPEAPPRRFDEPDGAPVMYRVRYYGGAWTDGTVPGCSHYIGCSR